MSQHISVELIKRYLSDACSAEEIQQVHDWFDSYNNYPAQMAELPDDLRAEVEEKIFLQITRELKLSSLASKKEYHLNDNGPAENSVFKKRPQLWKIISVAALLFLCFGVTLYFIQSKPLQKNNASVNKPVKDFRPGGNRAVLTLSNGTKVVLDSARNGLIARQGGISVRKTGSGRLVYIVNSTAPATDDPGKLNMIETPPGGQYQIELPDGTRAWLNARSSLKFPTKFTGNERRVEMTGEVYFEVAKNAAMPFKVTSKNTDIEVLGTHFNVMAYDDEAEQKTTLLEGSVKISANKEAGVLKPGQQAAIAASGGLSIRSGVDLENVMAWKNGFFDFKNTDLATIMRQAARWYGLQVVFEGQTARMRFSGKIPREVNLSELLNMFQYTGLKYKTDGETVTFLP